MMYSGASCSVENMISGIHIDILYIGTHMLCVNLY